MGKNQWHFVSIIVLANCKRKSIIREKLEQFIYRGKNNSLKKGQNHTGGFLDQKNWIKNWTND